MDENKEVKTALERVLGQLQYEISLLELDRETLTGVTSRTDELKTLINDIKRSVK